MTIKDYNIGVKGRNLNVREITFHDKLEGERPPLIFLHDGLGSIEGWLNFPLDIAIGSHCRTIIYERHGHGRSEILNNKKSLRFMHEEALDILPILIMKLSCNNPIFIGHSDGASIALIFAGACADEISGVVSEAAHIFVDEQTLNGVRRAIFEYKFKNLKEKLKSLHDNNGDHVFSTWSEIWLAPEFRSWNIKDYLYNITCPVLAIQGTEDEYGTLQQLETISKCLGKNINHNNKNKYFDSIIIPDCGHFPHKQAADVVQYEVLKFIEQIIMI